MQEDDNEPGPSNAASVEQGPAVAAEGGPANADAMEVQDIAVVEVSANDTEPVPDPRSKVPEAPKGSKSISAFRQSSWPSWRKHFYIGWRECPDGKVFALCKMCKTYIAGSWQAFSNLSLHASRVHTLEWNTYVKPADSTTSSPALQQTTITVFTKETKISSARQVQLDQLLARAMATGNIPFIFLRNKDFQKWVKGIRPLDHLTVL